jgi:hypothetical protein
MWIYLLGWLLVPGHTLLLTSEDREQNNRVVERDPQVVSLGVAFDDPITVINLSLIYK